MQPVITCCVHAYFLPIYLQFLRPSMRPHKFIALLILLAPFSSANSMRLLLQREDFRECEGQAMTALSIARNGMHLKNSKQSTLDFK